jgi:hypothetical protein
MHHQDALPGMHHQNALPGMHHQDALPGMHHQDAYRGRSKRTSSIAFVRFANQTLASVRDPPAVMSFRDNFEGCTLTIEQWLANREVGEYDNTTKKWRAIMKACALVLPCIGELRLEPRIGFDPVRDQMYFLFKADRAGTTFLVSPSGFTFDEDE